MIPGSLKSAARPKRVQESRSRRSATDTVGQETAIHLSCPQPRHTAAGRMGIPPALPEQARSEASATLLLGRLLWLLTICI